MECWCVLDSYSGDLEIIKRVEFCFCSDPKLLKPSCTTSNFYFPLSFLLSLFFYFFSFSLIYAFNMNSTSENATANPLGLAADTHGSLYKLIGVTLAICSGKSMTSGTTSRDRNTHVLFAGIFIGSSFVFKKKGLLQSTEKSGNLIN